MIKVWVIHRTGRKYFECQWIDPDTGLKRTRSTGQTRRREAERFAVALENDLNNPSTDIEHVTWKQFRKLYERSEYPGKSTSTKNTTSSTFNLVQQVLKPARPTVINTRKVTKLVNHIRQNTTSEFTVRRHLAELRKIMKWALRNGYIHELPNFEMPKKLTGAKARAVTPEEFERMLTAVPKVVGEERAPEWEFMLNGLWFSGLRLAEAMKLHWTDNKNLKVNLDGDHPMFEIQAHAEKGRRYRLLPMAPEFHELLLTVPENQRRGFVFSPKGRHGLRPLEDAVGKGIARIGRKAGVRVGTSEDAEKFASAHDLRRAFGIRWAARVQSSVLKEMMRHESITTTEKFYLLQEAEATAKQIENAYETKTVADFGNT